MKVALLVLVALGVVASAPAMAVPCADFADVEDTSPFCPSVEWIRNRGVTLGCTSTSAYCPNDSVTRLQMAAFMKRLGTALTGQQVVVEAAPGAVDLDTNPVLCQTADFTVTGYPRRAYVDLSMAARSPSDVDLAADLVISLNAGASWTAVNGVANAGSVPANQWGNVSDIGTSDLSVGQTVRFGVRVSRLSGTVDLSDTRCNLRAVINSRDGASTPL